MWNGSGWFEPMKKALGELRLGWNAIEGGLAGLDWLNGGFGQGGLG